MTKKDYVRLAAALAQPMKPYTDPLAAHAARMAKERVIADVADALAEDSPLFKRGRFLRAAGVRV